MAKSTHKKVAETTQSAFSKTLFKIAYRFSLHQVFDDFLTMAIAACTQNPVTKLSYYEDEYLQTIARYKDTDLRYEFTNAFAALIVEMEERVGSSLGNDVLGDFFEQHISNGRNGQFFTPAPVCDLMVSITAIDAESENKIERPLRILDPACGSGRMLLAAYKIHGSGNEYYGIDIDRTCVKMTALNLFLNGIWKSEVMCANALSPDDLVISYRISLLPFGIFKIEQKEQSKLYHMHKNSFNTFAEQVKQSREAKPFVVIPNKDSQQLDLFSQQNPS